MNPAHLLAHFDRNSEAPDAIPRLRRGARVHYRRLARFGHRSAFDFLEVGPEQREAVRGVAEEIAGDENIRDVPRDVGAHAGAFEERVGEGDEAVAGNARFGHVEVP